jgi:hypothetical protein
MQPLQWTARSSKAVAARSSGGTPLTVHGSLAAGTGTEPGPNTAYWFIFLNSHHTSNSPNATSALLQVLAQECSTSSDSSTTDTAAAVSASTAADVENARSVVISQQQQQQQSLQSNDQPKQQSPQQRDGKHKHKHNHKHRPHSKEQAQLVKRIVTLAATRIQVQQLAV